MNYRRSETQYAIAVREGAELLQTHTIRRSKTGIYLIFLRDNPEHDPHTSYHTDGKYHDKSFGHKYVESQRQPLDETFSNTEQLKTFSIPEDEARATNAPCAVARFDAVFEVAANELEATTLVSVDIVDHAKQPIITPGAHIIRQKCYGGLGGIGPLILVTFFKNPHNASPSAASRRHGPSRISPEGCGPRCQSAVGRLCLFAQKPE
jgi:hypothetical protein